MTRTYLIQVAMQVKRRPVESFVDPTYFGTVYNGLFLKKVIHCLFDDEERLVAVYYRNVLYCVNPTGTRGAQAVKSLYDLFNCKQKVFLYPNKSNKLYVDSYGDFRNKRACEFSQSIDYADVIPLPRA